MGVNSKAGKGNPRRTMIVVLAVVAILGGAAAIGYEVYGMYPHGARVLVHADGQAPKLQAMRAIKNGNPEAAHQDPNSLGDK